ncbi:hypothetical protein Asi03nite_57930 [Actinoplanes siamensis]|uniref:Uncharacterized protein n=1 Tax=Actinoplanes siamensis TaxID=1223317 RepID=A0A919NCJ1_9ACTN|nr:hypothetical protein Asi03nite_57930 [Actinoplanes siamensis]
MARNRTGTPPADDLSPESRSCPDAAMVRDLFDEFAAARPFSRLMLVVGVAADPRVDDRRPGAAPRLLARGVRGAGRPGDGRTSGQLRRAGRDSSGTGDLTAVVNRAR